MGGKKVIKLYLSETPLLLLPNFSGPTSLSWFDLMFTDKLSYSPGLLQTGCKAKDDLQVPILLLLRMYTMSGLKQILEVKPRASCMLSKHPAY